MINGFQTTAYAGGSYYVDGSTITPLQANAFPFVTTIFPFLAYVGGSIRQMIIVFFPKPSGGFFIDRCDVGYGSYPFALGNIDSTLVPIIYTGLTTTAWSFTFMSTS